MNTLHKNLVILSILLLSIIFLLMGYIIIQDRNLDIMTNYIQRLVETTKTNQDTILKILNEEKEIENKLITIKPRLDPELAKKLSRIFSLVSKRHDLDPDLLISIAYVESNFDNLAKSPTNDFGIMQINKVWTNKREWELLLSDNLVNIAIAGKILADLKSKNKDFIWRYNGKKIYEKKVNKIRNKI